VDVADFAGVHEERTVVRNAIFTFFDEACTDCDVARKLTETGEFGTVGAAHDVKCLVLECVSREGKLGKNDEISTGFTCLLHLGYMHLHVVFEVTAGRVHLGKSDSISH
jgi:hypothetical protein